MARFSVTFENNVIKKELFFMDKTFSYRMVDVDFGKIGDAKCFEFQVVEEFSELDEEIIDAVSTLDFGDEDEIEEALAVLAEWED
jgi:hypothetical protein